MTLGELFKSVGYATGMTGKWHLGASEQSWPTRQGFDQYRVGILESTDGTLYREGMQRTGMPDAVIAATEPYVWESDATGTLKNRPIDGVDHRELEWKQAEMARTLITAMMKDEGWQAMTMLDWEEGRDYEVTPGTRVRILPRDIPVAIEASLRELHDRVEAILRVP